MSNESRRRALSLGVLLATFALGAATGAGVHASFFDRRPHHERWNEKDRRLPPPFAELDLTAEQTEKAQAIFEKYRPQFDAVFQASMPKMNELRQAMDAELEPLLTESQRAKLEELRRKHPHRGPGQPPPPPPP